MRMLKDLFCQRTMPLVVSHRHNSSSHAVQQCYVLELIDRILLKHTEWLSEQDKLQTSRDFLNSSFAQVASVIDNQWSVVGTKITGPTKNCANAQSDIQDQDLPSLCQDSAIFLDQGLSWTITPVHELSGSTTSDIDRQALFSKYEVDCTHLKEQEAAFKSLTRDLSNLEYRLQEALKAFGETLQSPGLAQCPGHQVADREHGSTLSIVTTESSEDTPLVLEEYYSCMGNIGIYRERLQELDFHHEEGLVERQFLRETGQVLDVNNETFDRNYRSRRLVIEMDLDAALADASTLAERCRDAGINVDRAMDDSDDFLSVVSASEANQQPSPRPSRTPHVLQWLHNVVGG